MRKECESYLHEHYVSPFLYIQVPHLIVNCANMSSTGSTEKDHQFDDFDLVDVYNRSRARVLHPQTKNFVVEFGKKEVQIAFDLLPDAFGELLKKEHAPETPVRWM